MAAIRSWLLAASRASSSPVRVVVVGSSTAAGSMGTMGSTTPRRAVTMWGAVLRARHNLPDRPGGYGVPAANIGIANEWTRVGGSNVTMRGLGFTSWQLSPGNTLSRPWYGTAVTILFEQGPGAGAFQVSIDGGAATTVTPNTGAAVNTGTWTSPALSVGNHSVTITAVGTCTIEAVYGHDIDVNTGVQVWNGGLPGASTYELTQTPGLVTRIGQLAPQMVVVMLTANDYASGTDPAVAKQRIADFITSVFAATAADPQILLVHQHQRFDVTSPVYSWEQYGQVLRELADADPGRVAYVDVSGLFPTSQAADVHDLVDTDNTHLTERGHQILADALAGGVGMDATYDDTLSRVRVTAAIGPDAAAATVERSTDLIRWAAVRGGVDAPVAAGLVAVDDYEFTPGVANHYRVRAGQVILDGFGRAASSSWDAADTGQPWTTAGGSATDYAVSGGVGTHSVGVVASSRRTLIGAAARDSDTTITVSTSALAAGAAQHAALLSRHTSVDNMLMLMARFNTSQVIDARIVSRIASSESDLVAAPVIAGLTHAAGKRVSIRQQTIGTLIRLKIWDAAGAQPPYWHVTALSSAWFSAAGQVGARSFLFTGNTNTLPVTFAWDDFESAQVEYSGQVTPVPDRVWLKSVARPFLNRPVTVVDYSDVERPSRAGVFEVVGRSFPVSVNDVRGSRRWSLDVLTQTVGEAEELDLVLASGDPMFIHVPADVDVPGGHVVIGDTSRRRTSRLGPRRVFELPCTEIAAPGPDVVGATVTCQTVLAMYPTCEAVLDAHTTCLSLMELIGDPTDVIVP